MFYLIKNNALSNHMTEREIIVPVIAEDETNIQLFVEAFMASDVSSYYMELKTHANTIKSAISPKSFQNILNDTYRRIPGMIKDTIYTNRYAVSFYCNPDHITSIINGTKKSEVLLTVVEAREDEDLPEVIRLNIIDESEKCFYKRYMTAKIMNDVYERSLEKYELNKQAISKHKSKFDLI